LLLRSHPRKKKEKENQYPSLIFLMIMRIVIGEKKRKKGLLSTAGLFSRGRRRRETDLPPFSRQTEKEKEKQTLEYHLTPSLLFRPIGTQSGKRGGERKGPCRSSMTPPPRHCNMEEKKRERGSIMPLVFVTL